MIKRTLLLIVAAMTLSACGDEVGSKSWCQDLRDKPKTDWSSQNAIDYAKHCLLNNEVGSEQWCKGMDDTPKGDWTANQATSYAKHCVL